MSDPWKWTRRGARSQPGLYSPGYVATPLRYTLYPRGFSARVGVIVISLQRVLPTAAFLLGLYEVGITQSAVTCRESLQLLPFFTLLYLQRFWTHIL